MTIIPNYYELGGLIVDDFSSLDAFSDYESYKHWAEIEMEIECEVAAYRAGWNGFADYCDPVNQDLIEAGA